MARRIGLGLARGLALGKGEGRGAGDEASQPEPRPSASASPSASANRRSEKIAGAMSIAAGAVHAGLGPEHFAEWWGYGAFFVVAATAQVLLGLALLTDAIDPKGVANPARVKRWMYALGAVGQVALIALYVVTRTTGIPWLGPQAGVVEEVAPLDIITKIIEAGCAAILVMLLVRGARKPT